MDRDNNVKALKSGVWYTFANFITKGIIFLSTPIFARILAHADYGLYKGADASAVVYSIVETVNSFLSLGFL